MATDVTGTVLRGLGLPYVLTEAHIWDAQTTATQQGPTAGRAVPQDSYSLVLQTAGSQSASKELRVKVQRGGNPGPGGAEVIYQYDGDTTWRGQDVQQTSAYQVIRSELGPLTSGLNDPDATGFYDGDRVDKICAVYQRYTGSAYLVEAAVYDPAAGTWGKATIYTQTASPTDGYHPCVAYNEQDGYLYVCHWIYDTTAELAQIATHRSRDGATWETVSDWALDEGVDISGTPGAGTAGYEVGRLRMAFQSGQCLLMAHLIANNTSATRDQVGQWGSASRAAQFTSVTKSIVTISGSEIVFFSSHSVYVDRGVLTVTFPTVINGNRDVGFLTIIRLPSAFASIANRAVVYDYNNAFAFKDGNSLANGVPIDIPSGFLINDTDGSMWPGEDGAVYGAFRSVDSSATNTNAVYLIRSADGSAFKYTGNGDSLLTQAADAVAFYSGDTNTYLTDFVGVSHRGRQVLIGLSESDTTSANTLCALFLGGPTSVNLPARVTYPRPFQQSSFGLSYLPFELPANVGSLVTSGSGTDTLSTSGLLNRVTSSNTRISYATPTSTVAQGLIVRYAHTLNSGGNKGTDADVLKVRTADGVNNDYEVSLRFDGTGFRVFDDNASSAVGVDKGAVDPNSGIDVLVALVDGKLSVWYRALSSLSDRPWTEGTSNHSLTNDTSSPTGGNRVLFGVNTSATVDIDVHELHIMSGAAVSGGLGTGFTNPDDLRGRPLPRRGRYIGIDDGVLVTALDGSAKKGDTFHIDTAYEHPLERMLHRESPSPRTAWRSTSVTSGNVAQQRIAFVANPDATTLGSEEQDLGSTLMYCTLAGINWESGAIERYDTGSSSWVSVATISNGISTTYGMIRRGNQLTVPSVPTTSTGTYFAENECAGWTVKLGTTYRKISGNTPGTLATNISGPKPIFFLEDIDGSEPTLSTMTLIPDRVTVTFHTDGETGSGWALRIDAQQTAPYKVNGTATWDLRVGHLSLGRVLVFGTQYARGRVIMFEADDLTEDTPGGTRRAVRAGPGARRVRIAWTDPVDTTQVLGGESDPDYLKSTSTAGNAAVAAQKGLPYDLLGALTRQGARDPVTYLPRIEVSTGSTDTQTFLQQQQHLLATITSAPQIESVLGEEGSGSAGELFRVATVVLEELV